MNREFDTSFQHPITEILYLSQSGLFFLSNFLKLLVRFCALCGIIRLYRKRS